jgi:hypothetical protein
LSFDGVVKLQEAIEVSPCQPNILGKMMNLKFDLKGGYVNA